MGCGVRALDPEYRLGSEGLGDGDVVEVDGLEVHVVATPGPHRRLAVVRAACGGAVLTGDTVLGRGTTVVAHPDGQLGAYLDSLDRLHALAESHEIGTIWPGHGPVIDDALKALDYYVAHRAERLAQVESAAGSSCATSRTPRAWPPTSCRAAWSRSSTPTSTPCCGARPSSPSAPSWSTWRTATEQVPHQSLSASTIGHSAHGTTATGIPFARARQVGDGGVRRAAGRRLGGRLPVGPRRPRPQLRQGLRRQGRLERERLAQRLGKPVRGAQRRQRTAECEARRQADKKADKAAGAEAGGGEPGGSRARSRSRCRRSPPSRWPASTSSAALTPGEVATTPRLASGPQRIGGVLALLSAHDISVVGLQEFQPNQRAAFQAPCRRAGRCTPACRWGVAPVRTRWPGATTPGRWSSPA